jgi:hypothetical protein
MVPAHGTVMCAMCIVAVMNGVTVGIRLLDAPEIQEEIGVHNDETGELWRFNKENVWRTSGIPIENWYMLVFALGRYASFWLGEVSVHPLVTTLFKGTALCPTHLQVEADIDRMHRSEHVT